MSVLWYVVIVARICGRIETELQLDLFQSQRMQTNFWLQIKWNVVVAIIVTVSLKRNALINGGRV